MRRRFQFKLKTFFLMAIVVSVTFAVAYQYAIYQYATYPQRRWQAIQNSLTAIGKGRIEGAVLYESNSRELGKWRVNNLLELHFEGTNVTDEDLRHARVLDPETLLDLTGTKITDNGLKHLHGLRVKKIILTGTNKTEAGIQLLTKKMDKDVEIVKSN